MKKPAIILITCALAAIGSYYGYLKKKQFEKNEVEGLATITNVFDMTGDTRVHEVPDAIVSYRLQYEYEADHSVFKGACVITKYDVEFGFPRKFKVGTKVSVVYNKQNPADNNLKCKLKKEKDRINMDSIRLEFLRLD